MATVTMRYWAAAKQAAGVAEETISAETLGDALAAALAGRDGAAALQLGAGPVVVPGGRVGGGQPGARFRAAHRVCRGGGAAAVRRRLSRSGG